MKKMLYITGTFIILMMVLVLLFINKTREVKNIKTISFCMEADILKISSNEPAYFIKDVEMKKSGDTIGITVEEAFIYHFGNYKYDKKIKIEGNPRFIFFKDANVIYSISELRKCN